jgi:mRNA interferase MazF
MDTGEIYLAFFPYGDVPARKLRPVLLLTPPIGQVSGLVVAYISSVVPTALLPSDLVADPQDPKFSSTNLKKLSVLRLHKMATIHQTSIVRYLGKLSALTLIEVQERLRIMLKL